MRANGIDFTIVKNTLMYLAAEQAGRPLNHHFTYIAARLTNQRNAPHSAKSHGTVDPFSASARLTRPATAKKQPGAPVFDRRTL